MKNFSNNKERLVQYIEYKGLSKNKFYLLTGVSNGTLDKKSGLTLDTVEKFYSHFSDLNLEWLITGRGEMLKTVNTGKCENCAEKEVELKEINKKYTAALEEISSLKDRLLDQKYKSSKSVTARAE